MNRGSAYGARAPRHEDAERERFSIEGRLKVARGIATRAAKSGNQRQAVAWKRVVDELLDRLLEVRGR